MTMPRTGRPPLVMHASTEFESAPSDSLRAWQDENARGLSFAAVGAWSDAVIAFSAAVEAASLPGGVESHEALALVLGNLAQACFCAGDREQGVQHAQRACALRVALFGEDASTVARARSDLAVMLGSMGRANEALALTGRAISGIERSIGDEDIALIAVLENAARLAMAAGEPSTAEPYLLRLFSLRELHGLDTAVASELLSRVAAARSSTSGASPAVDILIAETVSEAVEADEAVEAPALSSSLDMIEMLDLESTSANESTDAHVDHATDDIFGSASIELVETAVPSAISEPVIVASASAQPLDARSVLGFTVEYGTPSEPTADEHLQRIVAPPTSVRIPTPVAVNAVDSAPPSVAPTLTLHTPNEQPRERRIRRPNFRWG